MARTGRRPGVSTTRAEMLDAARTLFGTHGYDNTTIRMVGEAAGVDSALVVRTFGGKEALFLAAVEWPWDPAVIVPTVAAGPKSRAGRRIAEMAVDTWEDPAQRAPILALLASTGANDVARTLLRDFISTQVLVPIVRTCGFDRPELRGSLLGAQLIGLVTARYVLAIEPLASISASALEDIAADAPQRVLTAELP